MSSFAPRVAGSAVTRPDPFKHVNYSLGMVLGVDDFTQEFAYLSGRDQTLSPGKLLPDFIVLDANPLEDIKNTRRISQVILRGAPVDRSQPVR